MKPFFLQTTAKGNFLGKGMVWIISYYMEITIYCIYYICIIYYIYMVYIITCILHIHGKQCNCAVLELMYKAKGT